MPQYIHNSEKITVPKGKTWRGYPVNSYTDAQLAEVGLAKHVPEPTPPYVPTEAELVAQYKIQLLNSMEAYINHKGYADAQGNPTKPEERIAVFVFGRIDRKGAANMPVSRAISGWADSVANLYYYRLGVLEQVGSSGWQENFLDFREAGLMPGSIGAALQE